MNKLYITVLVLLILPLLFFGFLGFKSQQGEAAGLIDGKLQACPDTPNCVYSETDISENKISAEHFIEPLVIDELSASDTMEKVKSIVTKMGGSVTTQEGNYLAATFTSSIFRYVDDLEVRFDDESKTLHFRSASRVGKSDLGVNRKRVDSIKAQF